MTTLLPEMCKPQVLTRTKLRVLDGLKSRHRFRTKITVHKSPVSLHPRTGNTLAGWWCSLCNHKDHWMSICCTHATFLNFMPRKDHSVLQHSVVQSCLTLQVTQGGCGCSIPGGIQGQAVCGSWQPGLVVGDTAHSRGVETRWSLWSFSTQAILRFYDSVIQNRISCCSRPERIL